jgi:HAD superfamily hydrolase (TIGR01509 family)
MYKAIVFDLDGTVIDSDDLVLNIYERLTKQFPPDIKLSTIDQETLLSRSYIEILKQLYTKPDEKYLNEIYHIHEALLCDHLKLYPNIVKTLEALKERGIKLYLFTSELRRIAITELVGLSIYHFFEDIIAFEDVERPKPDAEGLLKLMVSKRYNKHEMLFIGNSQIDGQAGKNAGIRTVYFNHHKDETKTIFFDDVMTDPLQLLDYVIAYEPAYRFNYQKDGSFKVLQFTDLHLMDNDNDIKTKKLLDKLIKRVSPDLICFTGDQTMSDKAPMLYQKLAAWIEVHSIPWTYVFGNHDTDFNVTYDHILEGLNSPHLIFKPGPKAFGVGNFFIELRANRKTKGILFFLDTHVSDYYMIDDKPTWGYGSLKVNQLKWYDQVLSQYHYPYEKVPDSLIFMHIPPYEFSLVDQNQKDSFTGTFEEKPCTPPVANKLMTYLHKQNSTKGIFVGHDHYNDFSFYHDNILLAYGRVSGYYEYGRKGYEKGARVISLFEDGRMTTEIIKIGKGFIPKDNG